MSSGLIPSLVAPTYTSFPYAIVVTKATPYSIGNADALYVTATISSGNLVVTKLDGNTIDLGVPAIGTIIPIASSQCTWGTNGSVVALRAR